MALDIDEGIKHDAPCIVVVYGPAKVGKTTFAAASSDRPLFISAEGGADAVNVKRVKFDRATGRTRPESWDEVLAKLAEIANEKELPFGSFTLDGFGAVENLCVDYVLKKAKKDALTDIGGGFGKGERALFDEMRRIFPLLERIRARGLHVILTMHAKFEKALNTTGADDAKRVAPALVSVNNADLSGFVLGWADAVLYADIDAVVAAAGDGVKKKTWGVKVGDGNVMYTRKEPGIMAGCRYGSIPPKLPLSWDVFMSEVKIARAREPLQEQAMRMAAGLTGEQRAAFDAFRASSGWNDLTELNKCTGWLQSLPAAA